ncbi:hypothetical protein MRY87_10680 [bacterium]|nr:hypothetical protein [bacterium]
MKKKLSFIFILLTVSFFVGVMGTSLASAETNTSFYPTWKLLKSNERKLFVSGYLQGWRDSKRVTEILKSHVKENPENAVASLEKVSQLYSTADIPIETLVERITAFYSDPENHGAPLSVAVSASR